MPISVLGWSWPSLAFRSSSVSSCRAMASLNRFAWHTPILHEYRLIGCQEKEGKTRYEYIEADGIRLPSRRRAYIRGTDSRPSLDPLLVSIDISDVRFS